MSVQWFRDAIVYHIFIDRFAGYDKNCTWEQLVFCGGNINGIIEKLSYLEELGVNTLWLSPFYKGSAYHGYHTESFFEVDPRFGDDTDVKLLVSAVHKKGIRIIVDFVPNHCSNKHPYFVEAQSDEVSGYRDWFSFEDWPDGYVNYLGVRELPKLNLDNPHARAHIIDAAKHWLSMGIDGYRLDYVLGPSHDFWKEFRKKIRKAYPDAVLIGEAWINNLPYSELKHTGIRNPWLRWLQSKFDRAPESLLQEYVGELDGVLDFKFYLLLEKYMIRSHNPGILKKKLREHYKRYPKTFFLPSFIDNHDVDRFLFRSNNKTRLKEVLELQLSVPQPKVLYYGTEIGMSQEKSMHDVELFGDVYCREPMKWDYQDENVKSFVMNLLKKAD